ncbi:unnamed protein product [Xylocopa violacea]|uniref:Uncharacterized protein n=1 Tax=Xylocopa violacea TaxID=135666 RepID=A0ABP1PBH3_XYLVO
MCSRAYVEISRIDNAVKVVSVKSRTAETRVKRKFRRCGLLHGEPAITRRDPTSGSHLVQVDPRNTEKRCLLLLGADELDKRGIDDLSGRVPRDEKASTHCAINVADDVARTAPCSSAHANNSPHETAAASLRRPRTTGTATAEQQPPKETPSTCTSLVYVLLVAAERIANAASYE